MNKIIFFLLVFLGILTPCRAESDQTEKLSIRTFYPAPYGAYKNVRLFPGLPAATACEPGTMYFNRFDNKLYICNGNSLWEQPGGDNGWSISGTSMYMLSQGNLSIGTTSPTHKLEVNGTVYALGDICIGSGKCLSQLVIPVINGTCGPVNGQDPNVAPTSGLCYAGNSTSFSGTGPWTWKCTGKGGGTTASCATVTWNGVCGSAAGVANRSIPTSNLCSAGIARNMTTRDASFNWKWTCGNATGLVNCASSHELLYCGMTNQWGTTHCKADCLARGGTLAYDPISSDGWSLYCNGLISPCTGSSWQCAAPYHYDCSSIEWGTFSFLACQINATSTTVCSAEDQLYGPRYYYCY